jgi:hypothetical protein
LRQHNRRNFSGDTRVHLRIVEADMPFSLGSYLLGVITVVGALAFGVGGGVFLTHTAMKESSTGQTRVERLARAEPEATAVQAPAVQVIAPAPSQAAVAPNPATAPDQDRPASVATVKPDAAPAEQLAVVPSDPVPAAQAAAPKPDAARKPEPETPRQAVRASRQPKQVEQTERTEAKPVESREADRRAERARRYADRRQSDTESPRMMQRREEPVQEVVVSRPADPPHFDLFGGLFGRPINANN